MQLLISLFKSLINGYNLEYISYITWILQFIIINKLFIFYFFFKIQNFQFSYKLFIQQLIKYYIFKQYLSLQIFTIIFFIKKSLSDWCLDDADPSYLQTGNLDPYLKGNTLYFPCGTTTIPSATFNYKNKSKVGRIYIPDSVKEIQKSAFGYYNNLTYVSFSKESKLRSIGEQAFQSCTALPRIQIYQVTYIGQKAFMGCSSLKIVNISSYNYTYVQKLTFYNCNSLETVILPFNLKTIGEQAFMCCFALKYINIPYQVKLIDQDAFNLCFNLTCVYIPNPDCNYQGAFSNTDEIYFSESKCNSDSDQTTDDSNQETDDSDTTDNIQQDKSNVGMIVGIVIGAVVLLIILIVVGIILYRKYKYFKFFQQQQTQLKNNRSLNNRFNTV